MNGMTPIVKKVAQLMCGLIFLYGVYIITHGHLSPGGGFAGGAIITGAFVLLILAHGSEVMSLRKEEDTSSLSESLALIIISLMALGGLFLGSNIFFNNYLPPGELGELISAGLVPLFNTFIGLEVSAALLTIFLALVIYKEEISQ